MGHNGNQTHTSQWGQRGRQTGTNPPSGAGDSDDVNVSLFRSGHPGAGIYTVYILYIICMSICIIIYIYILYPLVI